MVVVAVMAMGAFAANPTASVSTNGTEVTINVDGGYSDVYTVTDVYGSDITKLVKTGANITLYNPPEAAAYQSLDIIKGQFRVKRADQLGTGKITLGSGGGALMIPGVQVTVTNQVVFAGDNTYVAAFDSSDACVTLTSIGSTMAAPYRYARIGRTGTGYSKATLALTGDANDAMDRIVVQGDTDVTIDGGTIRMAAEAWSPFFYETNPGYNTYAVTPNGMKVDVAAGGDAELGITPTFDSVMVTNVVGNAGVENGGFSNNLTGWTITKLVSTAQDSGIRANGCAFDTDGDTKWTATNSPYCMLRINSSLSRTITIPSSGEWRVVFDLGCRPGSNYYSWGPNMYATVAITNAADGVIGSTTFHAPRTQAERHGFKRFDTDLITLDAGDYQLVVSVIDNDSDINKSLNFDTFRLEKVSVDEEKGSFTKTGAGRLTYASFNANTPIYVNAGSLMLSESSLVGTASVASGATLEARTLSMVGDDSCISVSSGGTLRITDTNANLVVNGDFERDAISSSDGWLGSNLTGWERSLTDTSRSDNVNGSGIQRNGSVLSADGPTSPNPDNTIFLRNYTMMKTTNPISIPVSGTYRLSFIQSCRIDKNVGQYSSHVIRTSVKIDGEEVYHTGPFDTPNYPYKEFSEKIVLEDGDHTLSFDTTGDTDRLGAMVFIDDVRLVRVEEPSDFSIGEVHLASGSTLQLDSLEETCIKNLYIDGVRINGRESTVRSHGVTVTGGGKLKAGDALGMTLIIR